MKRLMTLIGFLCISYIPAAVGSQFMPGPWYDSLIKPTWNPPDWVFAPVWTILYLMIGIAGYWFWQDGKGKNKIAGYSMYGLQIFLNLLWSPLFFGLKSPGASLVDILALFVVIILTVVCFMRVSRRAAYIMAPYGLWVGYACSLNAALYLLNR